MDSDRLAFLDEFDSLLEGDNSSCDSEFIDESEQSMDYQPESISLSDFEQHIIRRLSEDLSPDSIDLRYSDNLTNHSFKTKLLTAEQETELGCCVSLASRADALANLSLINEGTKNLIVHAGVCARTRMICSNLRLVAHIVDKNTESTSLEFDDLFEEGIIGLITAVEKYDYRKGFRFSTYAYWWIKQAVDRAIKNNTFPIRLPVYLSKDIQQMRSAYMRVSLREQREHVSCEKLSSELHWPVEKVRRLSIVSFTDYVSAELPMTGESGTLIRDILVSETDSPEQEELNYSLREFIDSSLGSLSCRDAMIIRRRYGLGRLAEEETLESIGESIGLTRERVRQVQAKGLERLRKRMLDAGLK